MAVRVCGACVRVPGVVPGVVPGSCLGRAELRRISTGWVAWVGGGARMEVMERRTKQDEVPGVGVGTGWSAARRGSVRTGGRVVAVVVGVAGVAAVAWLMMRGTPSAPVTPLPADLKGPSSAPGIGDLRGTPTGGDAVNIRGARGANLQWADEKDPARKAGELVYETLEPLQGQRYDVTQPRIRLYLRDGRAWEIESKAGRLLMPGTNGPQSIESGVLTGGVVAKLFDGGGGDSGPRVVLTYTSETFEFDGVAYEFEAPGAVRIEGESFDVRTSDVRVIISEVEKRVAFAEARGGGTAVLRQTAHGAGGDARGAEKAADDGAGQSGEKAAAGGVEKKAAGSGDAERGAVVGDGGASVVDGAGEKKAAGAADEKTPTSVFYEAVFDGGVRIEQRGRVLTSPRATVYAHTVDGKLAENAMGSGKGPMPGVVPGARDEAENVERATGGESAKTEALPASGAAGDAAKAGESATGLAAGDAATKSGGADGAGPSAVKAEAGSDDAIRIAWSGTMVMKPVETRPGLLGMDEVAVRFDGGAGGGDGSAAVDGNVILADGPAKADGTCDVLDYFVTRREAALASTRAEGVRVSSADAGGLTAQDLRVNLETGVAVVQGAGRLTGDFAAAARGQVSGENAEAKKAASSLAWTDRAEFIFQTDATGMTSRLQETLIYGGVVASDGGAELRGEFVRGIFAGAGDVAEQKEGAGDESPRLVSLLVQGDVSARDARGASLESEQLDVAFDVDERGRTQPALVVATGSVRARQSEPTTATTDANEKLTPVVQTLSASTLTARLVTTENGERRADGVKARGGVKFDDGRGTTASADQLDAAMIAERVTLRSLGGRTANVGKDGSYVRGAVIELDGKARTLLVPAAGSFDNELATVDAGAAAVRRAKASWTGSMRFDDVAGVLVAEGDARAESMPDEFTVEKLAGSRVTLELGPSVGGAAGSGVSAGTGAGSVIAAGASRELLRATVEGNAEANASIESRRYASAVVGGMAGNATGTGNRLERLFYLESTRIEADNVMGTLASPTKGRVLFSDRTQGAAAGAGAAAAAGERASLSRGDAMFEWAGSMVVERSASRVTLNDDVRVTQLRLGDSAPTEIQGRRLVALLTPTSGGASAPVEGVGAGGLGQLQRATVTGSVWARSSAGKELTADEIDYDAVSGNADAFSAAGSEVTLLDPSSGVPVRSRAIRLNLNDNTFRIVEPRSITIPR
jgi:hypothetical protein